MLEKLPNDIWRYNIATWLTIQDGIMSFTATCKLARFQLLRGHQISERIVITEQSKAWCDVIGIDIDSCRNKSAPFDIRCEFLAFEAQYCCYSDVIGRLVVMNRVYDTKDRYKLCGELPREDLPQNERQKIMGMCPLPDGRVAISYVDQVMIWDVHTLELSKIIPISRCPSGGLRVPRPMCYSEIGEGSSKGFLAVIDFIGDYEKLAVWDLYGGEEESRVDMISSGPWGDIRLNDCHYTTDMVPLKDVNSNIVIGMNCHYAFIWDIVAGEGKGVLVEGGTHLSIAAVCSMDNGGVAVACAHQDRHDYNNRLSDIKIFDSSLCLVDVIRFKDTIESLIQVDNGTLVACYFRYGMCLWSRMSDGFYHIKPSKGWKKQLSSNECVMLEGKSDTAYLTSPRLLKYPGKEFVFLIQRHGPLNISSELLSQAGFMSLIALDQQTVRNEFVKEWKPPIDYYGYSRHNAYHSVTNFGHRIHLNPI